MLCVHQLLGNVNWLMDYKNIAFNHISLLIVRNSLDCIHICMDCVYYFIFKNNFLGDQGGWNRWGSVNQSSAADLVQQSELEIVD